MSDLISKKAIMERIEMMRDRWGEDYDAEQILGDIEDMTPIEAEPFEAFAHWLASEVCNEGFEKMWSLGAFAEVACRKLCKLGLVRKDGEYWKMDEVEDE